MKKCYWIGHIDVYDDDGFRQYVDLARPVLQSYGARFLVAGADPIIAEGKLRNRHFVIEFDDERHAKQCFASDGYQAAKAHRDISCHTDWLMIEGMATG